MLTPGFSIQNDTIWPLQISLGQVGPLYYEVVKPGEYFVRDTGAVWFTLVATVFLNERERITAKDAQVPIISLAGAAIPFAGIVSIAAFLATQFDQSRTEIGLTPYTTPIPSDLSTAIATAAKAIALQEGLKDPELWLGDAAFPADPGDLTSAQQELLKIMFSPDALRVIEYGAYAGPPWPFRREINQLRISGGPSLVRIPGQNRLRLEPRGLSIGLGEPPKAYAKFALQIGTALEEADQSYQFVMDGARNLVMVRTQHSGSGNTEVHILTAVSNYQSFSTHAITPLGPCGNEWAFAMNHNGDLYAIKQRGTETGTTEVHILSADSNYRSFALQSGTALPETNANFAFAVAHNGDLVAIKKRGTGTHATEVHILSRQHLFQVYALQVKTALPECDDTWTFDVAPNRDVFAFKRNTTESGTLELHVLAASANYAAFGLQTKTGLHEVDNHWRLFTALNQDVFAIRPSGGESKKTEVHVLKAPA